MSKKTNAGKSGKAGSNPSIKAFQVKPVATATIAAIILDELSREYGDVGNYLDAVDLLNQGEIYLAYLAVQQRNSAIVVCTPRQAWVTAQAEAAVKKLIDPAYDRWPATRAAWFKTEHQCLRHNQRFAVMRSRISAGKPPTKIAGINKLCRRFYEALTFALGDSFPTEEVCESAYYGPGSTVGIRGREVHYVRKVETFECGALARDMAVEALRHDRAVWAQVGCDPHYSTNPDAIEGFKRVTRELLSKAGEPSDRLMFIHKSITALRSIGAQPTSSGMLQLGVHSIGVHILRNLGIDLEDQSRNQKGAYLGSRDWESENPYYTLDKSNASNLLALGLVQTFFPPAWGKALCRLRTTSYEAPPELGGGTHPYHMYAGMGNGTTFFVETLVFWAIAYATSDHKDVESFVKEKAYAIYGDDVVLRRKHAVRYQRLATFLGFQFNKEKTFLDGPFRESCGADYYMGVNVRPAYPSSSDGSLYMNELDLVGIHNTLADNRSFPLDGACRRIRRVWSNNLHAVIPTDPAGNLGFRPVGDVVAYSLVRDRANRVSRSATWQRPRTFVLKVKTVDSNLHIADPYTQLAVALLKARQSWKVEGEFTLSIRGKVTARPVPESDMSRSDLITMLSNQLRRLQVWKSAAWWKPSRGL